MPVQLQPARPIAPGVRIAASAVTELYQATAVLGYLANWGDIKAPWVERLANRDALIDELRGWYVRPENTECWADEEILFYAQRSGTLFDTSCDRFFARFDEVAAMPPGDTSMPTETQAVIDAVTERMARYHGDAHARRRYRQALEHVWEAIRPEWESAGLKRVEETSAALRAEYERTGELTSAIPATHLALRDQFIPIVEEGRRAGELVLAPCYFGGESGHVVALPGLVHVGFGFDFGRKIERTRDAAEQAAQSFKLVSDPTRAVILKLLGDYAYSITDLATLLGLAQPTISVHMKQLREAGLLTSERAGASTLYRADATKVRSMLEQASKAVLPR